MADLLPVTDEELVKLGVEPHLIPFVVSSTQRAGRSSSGEPQLTPTEAEDLVENLDRVPPHSWVLVSRAESLSIRSCHPT